MRLALIKNKTARLEEDLEDRAMGTGSRGRFVDLAAASPPPPNLYYFPFILVLWVF